jgi:hypothetical protein
MGFGAVPTRTLSVKANLSAGRITIPADFVGLSINPMAMLNGLLTGSSTSLINLIKTLGSNGIIRIGGADQDVSSITNAMSQSIANDLGAFVTALGTGWTCIYGLNAHANDSAKAATQAGYVASALGADKVVFQFGNEPIDGGSPLFTVATYQTMWNNYYSAVVAAVPTAKFAGPDTGIITSIPSIVAGLTPGKSGLSAITSHWYVPTSTAVTAQDMISAVQGGLWSAPGSFGFFKNNEWAAPIPLRLTESNNFSSGGRDGVSNRLCAATWYLNEAITFAKGGFSGINTHNNLWWDGSGGGPSGAVVGSTIPNRYGAVLLQSDLTSFAPGPIFYGLYLFSRIQGQQIIDCNAIQNGNTISIATIGPNGNANILVVNNDVTNSVAVTPDQSSAWSTANVLLLSGTDAYDAAPTLGGAAIGNGGSWSGAPVSINSGATVTIPPCGAALISIQP